MTASQYLRQFVAMHRKPDAIPFKGLAITVASPRTRAHAQIALTQQAQSGSGACLEAALECRVCRGHPHLSRRPSARQSVFALSHALQPMLWQAAVSPCPQRISPQQTTIKTAHVLVPQEERTSQTHKSITTYGSAPRLAILSHHHHDLSPIIDLFTQATKAWLKYWLR